MDSSAEEVLLESCCFLWNYYQEQIKRKRNRTWVREMFKKMERRVYHNLLQKIHVNDRESYFKYTFNCKNCSTVPQAISSFSLSLSLSLCILNYLFHKGKDTSAIAQPSVHHLVYIFLIFFCFYKCLISFRSSINLLRNKFVHWNMCFFIFLLPWRRRVAVFSLK